MDIFTKYYKNEFLKPQYSCFEGPKYKKLALDQTALTGPVTKYFYRIKELTSIKSL